MKTSSINVLDCCKKGLKLRYEQYDAQKSNQELDIFLNNEEYQEARRIIINISNKMEEDSIPEIIALCRDVDEATNYLMNNNMWLESPYVEIDAFISSIFNRYMDFLESNSIQVQFIEVQMNIPDKLTYETIYEDVKKCEDRLNIKDYSGAITSAKTLVEGVCKELLFKIEGNEIKEKHDLLSLFKRLRKKLNLNPDNPKLEKSLKQVISGFIHIVHGLAEIRNSSGDSHPRKYAVDFHHALLVVNSAKTVVTFLFDTYEYQLNKKSTIKVK